MKESITNKVADYRLQSGVTQESLAAAVSVSRQTISALEKGNYIPSVLLSLKIAHFFKVSVEDIFTVTYETK
jgi:putative transcriptional regulator